MKRTVISLMDKQLGPMFLLGTHLGVASNVVQAHQRDERKSIGAEWSVYSLSLPKFVFRTSTLAGDSTQPSYTQKRTVKRIFIRCGSHGYSAEIHAFRLCSHLRFCVCDCHVPFLARGDSSRFAGPLLQLVKRSRSWLNEVAIELEKDMVGQVA